MIQMLLEKGADDSILRNKRKRLLKNDAIVNASEDKRKEHVYETATFP